MSQYFRPLWVFIGGNLLLLILWMFLPSIGDAGDTLAGDARLINTHFHVTINKLGLAA